MIKRLIKQSRHMFGCKAPQVTALLCGGAYYRQGLGKREREVTEGPSEHKNCLGGYQERRN